MIQTIMAYEFQGESAKLLVDSSGKWGVWHQARHRIDLYDCQDMAVHAFLELCRMLRAQVGSA